MTETSGPDQPLDDLDRAILDQVRAYYDILDPPPADLDLRSQFAIQLTDVNIEVSRLYEDLRAGAGARAPQPVRTVTFEAAHMTIMVTVAEDGGRLRVEGWLAPPAPLQVELRTGEPSGDGCTRHVTADDAGRFIFADVTSGLAQLAVRQPTGITLVTPPIAL